MDVHAHELFHLIDAAPRGVTVEEQREQSAQVLGPDATFTTCSGKSYTFEQIIDFFNEANKVVVTDGRMQLNKGRICSH